MIRRAQRSRLTVFITILALFALIVVVTGAAITITNFIQTRRAAVEIATTALDAATRRIGEQRNAFLNPVSLLVALFSNDPRVVGEPGQIDAILFPLLSGLERNPQISGIYVGYENGEFFQVLSFSQRDKETIAALRGPPDARFALQTIRLNAKGARIETLRFFDDDQREITSFSDPAPAYDPRTRSWYKDARAKPREFIRTAPYVFAATPQVGLTIATTFDGPVGGVVAADVTLDRMSDFLNEVRPNARHRVLQFDEGGDLIAFPDPDRVLKRTGSGSDLLLEPAKVTDLDDPVIQTAMQYFTQNGPFKIRRIAIHGEVFLASVTRQRAANLRDTYILYAAPRSEFEGTFADAAVRGILPGLLVIFLISPAIVYLARLISRPPGEAFLRSREDSGVQVA